MMTRRHALKTIAWASVACATVPAARILKAQPPAASPSGGPFTLPPLGYPFDALEPHIDAQTMQIHHDKYHAAYVMNLNKILAEFPEIGEKPVEELLKHLAVLPERARMPVRNQGGGHYHHSMFWKMMKKNGGGQPSGELSSAIDKKFGSFSAFKDQFTKAAVSHFGCGWAWLVIDEGELKVDSTPKQDSLISEGAHLLLGVDVWEHAYYLRYENRRADYVTAWFNVVNWDYVSERFKNSKGA
jgi:Fe-Mn family superoxide dismutase